MIFAVFTDFRRYGRVHLGYLRKRDESYFSLA